MGDAPVVNGWHEAALVTITLSGMFLTAQTFSRKRPNSAEGTDVTGPPAATPLAQLGST